MSPGLATKRSHLQGLWSMARPGLEPGTPRFSGSRPVACLRTKGLQIRAFSAVMPRRDPVTFGRFGARLGLCGGVEVPVSRGRTATTRKGRSAVCATLGSQTGSERHAAGGSMALCMECDSRLWDATRSWDVLPRAPSCRPRNRRSRAAASARRKGCKTAPTLSAHCSMPA